MKGLKTILIVLTLFAFNLSNTQAQEESTQELSLDKGPIDSQFDFIYKKSGNYRADGKRYEVVRIISLDKLRKNVLDSLNAASKKAAELNATISGHEATIESLNKKLAETTNNLASVTEEKTVCHF